MCLKSDFLISAQNSAVGDLRPPALLAGASEVLTALLMASSSWGSVKCTIWMEMGKGEKK